MNLPTVYSSTQLARPTGPHPVICSSSETPPFARENRKFARVIFDPTRGRYRVERYGEGADLGILKYSNHAVEDTSTGETSGAVQADP
jgi:hypothetical protein